MHSRRVVTTIRWTLAFGSLAGIVLVYQRWVHVNSTTVALSLLLLILLLAAEWGLRYALVISVLATASYNFFFLPPIGTFTIEDPQNWLALFAFLSTAIIASRLSQRARDEASEARKRQREVEILFRLSRELLHSESVLVLLSSAPASVASVTGARATMLYLLEGDRLYQAGSDGISAIEMPHLRQVAESLTTSKAEGDEMQVPLRSGVRPKGLLLLRGATLSLETAEAVGGLISISIDRAQALESVARAEAAKESERLRTLMIDSVTHELRTPLTSIKGAASTLLSGDLALEDRQELLTIINEESDRLNRLVSEAVEMAQLDAQQVQMHFAAVSIAEIVRSARSFCSSAEDHHGLNVHVPEELKVNGDPAFLQKVLCNLLENAAKYSAEGTPISISAEQRDHWISISVADRGIGIDAAEQALIFERFYRARPAGSATGTGMGLAISRSIVEAHGGKLYVTSQPGRGSVFTFELPVSNVS
ncbi:MAG: sensor histidine kinase [Janthinobacterium lividum]